MKKLILFASLSFCVSSFAAEPCGLTGTLNQRLESCRSMSNGNSDNFKVVSSDGKGHDLVLDVKTNIIWSQHFKVQMLKRYTNKIDYGTVINFCQRFVPFNMEGGKWRLPSARELKCAHRRGLRTIDSWGVISSKVRHRSYRTYTNGRYGREEGLVTYQLPYAFSEASGRIYKLDMGILEADFRCVWHGSNTLLRKRHVRIPDSRLDLK